MKEVIKKILKKTFVYRIYRDKQSAIRAAHLKQLSEMLKDEGPRVLQLFSKALDEADIKFWIDYGTLLGFHREHDFIAHDNDLDTGAFIEDAPRIKVALEKIGFRLIRHYRTEDGEGLEHCYAYKDSSMTIDVFYYRRNGNTVSCICYYPKPEYPVEKNLFKEIPFTCYSVTSPFTGLVEAVFKDAKVYIPINTDEYLQANYGEHYMTPDPNYSASDSTNLHKFSYEEKPAVGYLEIPY